MKPFTTLASIFFAAAAVLHIFRVCYEWEASLNGMIVPHWVSWLVIVVAGIFAVMLWKEARR